MRQLAFSFLLNSQMNTVDQPENGKMVTYRIGHMLHIAMFFKTISLQNVLFVKSKLISSGFQHRNLHISQTHRPSTFPTSTSIAESKKGKIISTQTKTITIKNVSSQSQNVVAQTVLRIVKIKYKKIIERYLCAAM